MTPGKHDAAIIFTKRGGFNLHLPKTNPVPDHAMTAAALVSMLTAGDKKLLRLIRKQVKEFEKTAKEGRG